MQKSKTLQKFGKVFENGVLKTLKTKLFIGIAGVAGFLVLSYFIFSGASAILSVITSFFDNITISDTVAHKLYLSLQKESDEWINGIRNSEDLWKNRSSMLYSDSYEGQYMDLETYLNKKNEGAVYVQGTIGDDVTSMLLSGTSTRIFLSDEEDANGNKKMYIYPFSFIPQGGMETMKKMAKEIKEFDKDVQLEIIATGNSDHTNNIKDILCMTDVMFKLDQEQASDENVQSVSDTVIQFEWKNFKNNTKKFFRRIGNWFSGEETEEDDAFTVSYSRLKAYAITLFDSSHQESIQLEPIVYPILLNNEEPKAGITYCPEKGGCQSYDGFKCEINDGKVEYYILDENNNKVWVSGLNVNSEKDGLTVYMENDDDPDSMCLKTEWSSASSKEELEKVWDEINGKSILVQNNESFGESPYSDGVDKTPTLENDACWTCSIVIDDPHKTPGNSIADIKKAIENDNTHDYLYEHVTCSAGDMKSTYGTTAQWSEPVISYANKSLTVTKTITFTETYNYTIYTVTDAHDEIVNDYDPKTGYKIGEHTERKEGGSSSEDKTTDKTVTVTITWTYTHNCIGHTGHFCGGHIQAKVNGHVYSFPHTLVSDTPEDEGVIYDKVLPIDDTLTLPEAVRQSGINLLIDDDGTWKTQKSGEFDSKNIISDSGAFNGTGIRSILSAQDIFDVDLLIKYGKGLFPIAQWQDYEGWTDGNIMLAGLKYKQDWMSLYGFDIATNFGTMTLTQNDIEQIINVVGKYYGNHFTPGREQAIRLALNCVGNGAYNMKHHDHAYLHGNCGITHSDTCHITDCSGFISYIFLEGGKINKTLATTGFAEQHSLIKAKYRKGMTVDWNSVYPGDAIVKCGSLSASEGGSAHALLFIGQTDVDIDLSIGTIPAGSRITVDCLQIKNSPEKPTDKGFIIGGDNGVGNIYLRWGGHNRDDMIDLYNACGSSYMNSLDNLPPDLNFYIIKYE